eukprot:6885920-Pyramimonas_sp.AAC.1
MVATWVSIAEATILEQRESAAAGRSRAEGPFLTVEAVQRAEHMRVQPLTQCLYVSLVIGNGAMGWSRSPS